MSKGGDVLADSSADFSKLDPKLVSTILVPNGNKNAGVYETERVHSVLGMELTYKTVVKIVFGLLFFKLGEILFRFRQ